MKKQKDNKKKWTVIIVSAFIVFSMVISIFAIVVDNQNSDTLSYNKHSFVMTNSGFKTKIAGNYMDFYYYPSDLERINISNEIMLKLNQSQGIAFVFDPLDNITDNLQYIDVVRYEAQTQFDKPVYFGITRNSSNYALPIVSCNNATSTFPFIMIDTSNNPQGTTFSISKENPNCIIMNARLKDMLAAKDRLVYTYYGIMTPQ